MGLYKRGTVWWMSFVYWGRQHRKSTETEDRKLAERIYDKVKGQIAEGKWFDTKSEYSFKEMTDRYLVEHIPKKKSARFYRGCVQNLLSFFGEDVLISQITPSKINDFIFKRRKEGVESATINRDLSILKNCFNIAMKQWEWVESNPVSRIPMEKEPPGRVRYLSEEEFEKLYDACSEWLKPIVLTARHTGMRKGNILSLKWDQVDLFRRLITLENTKNDQRLCIPMNDTLFELFKKLAKVRHIKSQYVFFHPDAKKRNAKGTFNGERYHEVKTSFKEALGKAGIKDFKFHDLRHQFASDLVQRGVEIYDVQRLLGHKAPLMTQRYAHLAPENLRRAVLKLDRLEDCEGNSHITNLSQSQKEKVNQVG